MKSKLTKWAIKGLSAGLILATATGCMSKEDRIRDVVSHEIEKCKQSEDDFYVVEAHDGTKYRILAELCHQELSAVSMNNEFTGNLTTGPLVWTAGEDQQSRAMVITRVSWTEFDRAMRYRGERDPGVDALRAAEQNFAAAQEAYPDSAWLRLERLNNLLDLRAKQRTDVEDPYSIGAEARAYFDELIAWAKENDNAVADARARLATLDYLEAYRERQQRGLNNLGSQDRRLENAIKAAEEEGDRETLQAYTQELNERRERRPQAQAEIQERMELAQKEMCALREGMSVTGITDDSLRSRITSALRTDCALAVAGSDDEAAQ